VVRDGDSGGRGRLKKKIQVSSFDELVKSPFYPIFVIPAKAGIQLIPAVLDSCFRRSDGFVDSLRSHQF